MVADWGCTTGVLMEIWDSEFICLTSVNLWKNLLILEWLNLVAADSNSAPGFGGKSNGFSTGFDSGDVSNGFGSSSGWNG